MKGFKIHLICNGLAEGSDEGKYLGRMDVGLSEDGRKHLKNILNDEGYSYPEVQAVISSPLKRCTETAKIIYPEFNPIIINELTECDFGEFAGKTAEDLKDSEEFKEWLKGSSDARAPYGESNSEFQKRVCTGFKRIVEGIDRVDRNEMRSVAIITHGGVIMTIMQYFALPECPMHEWIMPAGHGYTLNFNSRLWESYFKIEALEQIPLCNYADNEFDADV